jgi:hypothetical protein
MTTNRNLTELANSLASLPADGRPVKKTSATKVAKIEIDYGTITFNNSKNYNVNFSFQFTRVPLITLTFNDSGGVPAYKALPTTNGVQVKMQSNWTGAIDWVAAERP